jgi:hypothetical protein
MPQIVAEPLWRPAVTCFPGVESKNLNYLVLILSDLARAARGRQGKLRQPARPALSPSPAPAVRPTSRLHALSRCNHKESGRC